VLTNCDRDFNLPTYKHDLMNYKLRYKVAFFHLDFPRYASFAAVKLVMWWEEQFSGAFRRPSGLIGSARSSSDSPEVSNLTYLDIPVFKCYIART